MGTTATGAEKIFFERWPIVAWRIGTDTGTLFDSKATHSNADCYGEPVTPSIYVDDGSDTAIEAPDGTVCNAIETYPSRKDWERKVEADIAFYEKRDEAEPAPPAAHRVLRLKPGKPDGGMPHAN